jgi:hypothetical protein
MKTILTWIWNRIPTCREMTRLASASCDDKHFCPKTKLKIWLHFAICAWCRRYFQQIKFLHRAALNLDKTPPQPLSPEARQRLKAAIQEKM